VVNASGEFQLASVVPFHPDRHSNRRFRNPKSLPFQELRSLKYCIGAVPDLIEGIRFFFENKEVRRGGAENSLQNRIEKIFTQAADYLGRLSPSDKYGRAY
jgi:hypothetical protein